MNKKLKKLALELNSRGHNDAYCSVINLMSKLNDSNHIKTALTSADVDFEVPEWAESINIKEDFTLNPTALGRFWQLVGEENPHESKEIKAYRDLIACAEDLYCGYYRNKEFDDTATEIMQSVITPLIDAKNELTGAFGSFDTEDKELLTNLMSSESNIDLENIIQEARAYHVNRRSLTKIGSKENQFSNKFYKYAFSSGSIHMGTPVRPADVYEVNPMTMGFSPPVIPSASQSWFQRLSRGDNGKAALRAAGKRPGFWGKAMPFVGIVFSLPLTIKNLLEAIENGKSILYELPLEKYNISKANAFTPTGALMGFMDGPIAEALEANKNNPENLKELLTIMKTISAFWLDFIFTVTNAVSLILDVAAILATFLDGPLPVADVLAGGISLLVTAGIVGMEYGSEHFVNQYWATKIEKLIASAGVKIEELESASYNELASEIAKEVTLDKGIVEKPPSNTIPSNTVSLEEPEPEWIRNLRSRKFQFDEEAA